MAMRKPRNAFLKRLVLLLLAAGLPAYGAEPILLRSPAGIEAVFETRQDLWVWTAYRDTDANQTWPMDGPRCSIQTPGGEPPCPIPGFAHIAREEGAVVLETDLGAPPVTIRQRFSFCSDQRTLRIATSLRAQTDAIFVQRIGLLELQLPGESLKLMGPERISSPVFGERLFAGIEHPSAFCEVKGDTFSLSQHPYAEVKGEWRDFPPAIFGTASNEEINQFGVEALRRAFLRYLDTVRVKPADMHVHYNDWWTAPVPSSQEFVLGNIAALEKGLYDQAGVFFDSYALDAGWSDTHSVWQIDTTHFPQGFKPIQDALAQIGARPGLWVSPSSLYPFALDNAWLESAGYEVTPHPNIKLNACLAKGGKYQRAFKEAVLKHAADAHLAHVKFDGYVHECSVESHGHKLGPESRQAIAEGLMEVFDALRAQDPGIALEPTCFGYQPSPWWLMHTPFIIGPFGDDCPPGMSPCPEWIEALTTARDDRNLTGRKDFLMPSAALQCFDIIVQNPGAFQNHAAMAIGRGRWFLSCYIHPKYMDEEEWRFFGALITWARHNREFLQEPLPIGGQPAERQAYGYAFLGADRQLFCLRNPWIEETAIALPDSPSPAQVREIRAIYPRREIIARIPAGEALPEIPLGPYETRFIEIVPTTEIPQARAPRPARDIAWNITEPARFERVVYESEPAPFGPSWAAVEGDAEESRRFALSGELHLQGFRSAELCVLCENDPGAAAAPNSVRIDGVDTPCTASTSYGAFSATSWMDKENWTWFTAPLSPGAHRIDISLAYTEAKARFSVFLRGVADAPPMPPPFGDGPAFPLYQPESLARSQTLVPAVIAPESGIPTKTMPRTLEHIDGVYLDTLDWNEATAGWGQPQRNKSVMEKRMTLGGKAFWRGIGTHANSRIAYTLPEGYATFAATIGKDQEVAGGSVVFVVQIDGQERYRSPAMSNATPPIDIAIPVAGAHTLTLIIEDAEDGVGADHADWANARLLKLSSPKS